MNNSIMINTQNWPVCVMNTFPTTMMETQSWLSELEQLLAKKTPFVLIYPPMESKGKPTAEDMECMKFVRRWLKDGREAMAEYCRAMVIILQPDGRDKDEMGRTAPVISSLYGPEVFLVESSQAAQQRATEILNRL
ncbi:hypothetical protein LDO51_14885 [Providencia alcalifaciens]|uniref:hypothetical protein n=1 Tax=Providencia alcalifaciens TaxID=126385 RepID=UPI001CE063C6|nr:hypothetical protein LDO51_14885 [Providencia alcalifaciens]